MRRVCTVLLALASLLGLAPAAGAQVRAGVAVLDGTYHVGNSAGQYSSTRDGGYGEYDPHVQQVKNQASYGVQARMSVRALVVKGADGKYVAMVSNDHYIPQDALLKRTAQLASQKTGGAIDASNLTLTTSHNHSSPSYSSLTWGVWAFQDVFDFRFFTYYAERNATAIARAFEDLHAVRVSGTARYFDAFHKNPMGPARADDGTPAGYPRSMTDHDLSVVRFENIDNRRRPAPLATLVNIGQHPEFLDGVDLITSEYVGATQRFIDRTVGGVTIFTQNATGTSEVEEEYSHGFRERTVFNQTQYNQMEWAARLLADAAIASVREIDEQRPHVDEDPRHDPASLYGGTPYHERFVRWMSDFPVGMQDVWFPGPVSHPYPGVSSCRSDSAFAGNPRVPIAGLPDCTEAPIGSSLMEVVSETGLPVSWPGVDTDTLQAVGVPVPETYSAPSFTGVQDTVGVHLQAIRLGDILLQICSCEQWVDQSYNQKTRSDTKTANEYLGYDPTAPHVLDQDGPPAHNRYQSCTSNGDGTHRADGTGTGTWTCLTSGSERLSDRLIQRMRARIGNDAAGWDDPACREMGCGLQGEAEPTDLAKIRGNFTHDDTPGKPQGRENADRLGYRLVVPISMANDYNGYIATYRDYVTRDHYRKALTGFGAHSMDYMATRLVRMGRALKGDGASAEAIAVETDPAVAAAKGPQWLPLAGKERADQAAEDAKVRAVGEAAARGVQLYDATVPDDGGKAGEVVAQPRDIMRFDAATFTWVGGNNYTDMPAVVVERRRGKRWVTFADQSGEIPISLDYPGADPTALASYRAGGQVWKWTATFEAMVNRFGLVAPSGKRYRATPAGDYRFVVRGVRRSGGGDVPYLVTSRTFRIDPWHGITVDGLALDADRRLTFAAGPRTTFRENHVKSSQTRNWGPLDFTIGPVDYPDFASDDARKASGFRFLDKTRTYSASNTDPTQAEHYCLMCRFRDWQDASSVLTATVTFRTPSGEEHVETVSSNDGSFRTNRVLGEGETAEVVIEDEWGNTVREPATISG